MPNFKNPIRMTKNCASGKTYWPTADKKSLPTYSRPGPSNWTKSIFRWFQVLGAVGLCCDDPTGETPRQVRCHESCHPQLCRMSKSVVLWCLVACWGYTDKMKANTHVLQMLAGGCLLFRTHSQLSWLVVSTHVKNISQLGWLFPIYGKIWKNKTCSKPPTSIYSSSFFKAAKLWLSSASSKGKQQTDFQGNPWIRCHH